MATDTFRSALVEEIPRLRRLAHRLSPPQVEPDDLVQDVLERAWRSRERFRGESSMATWLHRVMANRAVDLGRKALAAPWPDEVTEPSWFEVCEPLAVIERAEDATLLRAALSRLDPVDRAVLALRDGEGWSAVQVAEACGLSVDAVHKRLQRGRLRLARELGRDGPVTAPSSPSTECRRARTVASEYLDGTLDRVTHRAVDAHLRECARCPPLLQALVGVQGALRTLDAPAPARLAEAVMLSIPVRLETR